MWEDMNVVDDDDGAEDEPSNQGLMTFTENKTSTATTNSGGLDIMDIMGNMNTTTTTTTTTSQPPQQNEIHSTTTAPAKAYKDPFANITSGTQPPPNTSTNKASNDTGNDLSAFFGGNASSGGSKMNGNAPNTNTSGSATSAFGFDLSSSTQGNQQPTASTNTAPTNSGTSAFGFDLSTGGGGNASQPTQAIASQPKATTSSSMNSSAFGIDIGGGGGGNNMNQNPSSMMTSGMLQQSNQTQMNAMNQMNMNPNMMQQNMMNQNMMNQNMMQQQM